MVPSDREDTDQAWEKAQQESQRADRLTARLRALGIDPDSLDE